MPGLDGVATLGGNERADEEEQPCRERSGPGAVSHLSDRLGRWRIYILVAPLTGVCSFIYVGLLDTASPTLVSVAIFFSLIPHDIMYGPQPA